MWTLARSMVPFHIVKSIDVARIHASTLSCKFKLVLGT